MAYKQSTMHPITVQLQEGKALASTCSMSNRFYAVGWDVEHLLNVISEIIGALVVILLHGLSSIRLSFLQRVLIQSMLTSTQLPRNSDKWKSNQTTRPRETANREATRHRKTTTLKNTKRGNDLVLSVDVQSLGQGNASGDLLSTNLGLSLASTSWVDRVDLYGLIKWHKL
jgi:hypothetical protein